MKNTYCFNPNQYERPIKLRADLIDAKDGKKILKKGSKINLFIAKKSVLNDNYEIIKQTLLGDLKKIK